MDAELTRLSERDGEALCERSLTLATAESCTGGWVAQVVTHTAGSSAWFDRGFVTYTNESKADVLGVRSNTIERFGAVSMETAAEMATGALGNTKAMISLAITGIAGPTGGSRWDTGGDRLLRLVSAGAASGNRDLPVRGRPGGHPPTVGHSCASKAC